MNGLALAIRYLPLHREIDNERISEDIEDGKSALGSLAFCCHDFLFHGGVPIVNIPGIALGSLI